MYTPRVSIVLCCPESLCPLRNQSFGACLTECALNCKWSVFQQITLPSRLWSPDCKPPQHLLSALTQHPPNCSSCDLWVQGRQHPHHLDTSERSRSSGPRLDVLNFRNREVVLIELSRWSWCMPKDGFRGLCVKDEPFNLLFRKRPGIPPKYYYLFLDSVIHSLTNFYFGHPISFF